MIAGIDEAGKGPVLGPMCVAGVLLDENKLGRLARLGVKDSKKLTPKKREALSVEIKKLADRFFILEVSPGQIDELRKVMTMNEIMVACYVKVLEELMPDSAFVDAADVIAQRFGENIKKKYSGDLKITSEHNADEKYPIVSAASIIAKVRRDELIRNIEKTVGTEIGSGYPSDRKTITFLEKWVMEHGSLPDFARSSWETSKNIIDKFGEKQRVVEGIPLKKAMNSQVYVIKTSDRTSGISELLKRLSIGDFSGKKVAIKANFNSADPFPASTHPDTLSALVDFLKENGASIVLAERSGMGNTRKVLEETGVLELAGKKGFDVVVLDDRKSGWGRMTLAGSHWKKGFLFSDVFREADAVVQTCCLKTHRYGGHVTLSLKNSVGMVARYDPENGYDYMGELHGSRYQRQMIAEINMAYEPEFVIMDGIEGFSKGGPDKGTLIRPGILIASRDRVAVDAAGVAVLRIYGTTDEVGRGGIFEQEQIARAAELGLGVTSPDKIELIAVNEEAGDICKKIEEKLRQT